MITRNPSGESSIRRILRYFGITTSKIAEQAGTNSHTVNRVLDMERFEAVQFRNALKVRRAVRELLEQTDFTGDILLLWLEYDDPEMLERLLRQRPSRPGQHYSGLPPILLDEEDRPLATEGDA